MTTKTRTEKFSRVMAIIGALSASTKDRNTLEHKYVSEFKRDPVKFLGIMHREMIDESSKWDEKEWLLFDLLTAEIAELDLEEFTDETLDDNFYVHLYRNRSELKNIIGVEEAAKMLNLSPGTIKNKCAAGELPATKVGKTWVLDKALLGK